MTDDKVIDATKAVAKTGEKPRADQHYGEETVGRITRVLETMYFVVQDSFKRIESVVHFLRECV